VLARRSSEIEVPDTIQGIIAARMDRIEDNLKRIMQVASVIGREFAYRILATITGMKEELKASLLNLQGLEFIYEKQLFPELEYIFKHALTQEVAYNSLLLKRRKEIHEKIGRAIEELYSERLEEFCEVLAYHYARSDNKEKAVEYLNVANQKAIRASAMEEAKNYFDECMRLLDALPDNNESQERRISLLVNQWFVFQLLLKVPEHYALLIRHESLAVRVGNPALLGTFYVCLGHCEFTFGTFDDAIQTLNKAAQLCEAAGNAEDAGFAYMYLQWSHVFRGDYGRVLALKEDALGKIDQRFVLHRRVRVLTACSWALSDLGRWDEAVEVGEEALTVAKEFLDNSQISLAAWIIAKAYIFKGDLGQAIQYIELAVQKARTPADKMWSRGMLSWARCRAGEPDKEIENLASLVPIARAARQMPAELPGTLFLGEAYWLAEEHDKARQTVEQAVELAERCGARYYIGWSHRLLGEIALKTNPDEALSHFEKSIAINKEIKAANDLALAYSGMGRFHKQQGNTEQAREYLTKALEIFERLGTLIEPDKVREELGELPPSG